MKSITSGENAYDVDVFWWRYLLLLPRMRCFVRVSENNENNAIATAIIEQLVPVIKSSSLQCFKVVDPPMS